MSSDRGFANILATEFTGLHRRTLAGPGQERRHAVAIATSSTVGPKKN
jgi:hypothetical protein